jgi:O-methyltransferase
MNSVARRWLPPAAFDALRRLRKRGRRANLPDADLYDPVFAPWRSPEFSRLYAGILPYTLVSPDRCWILWSLLRQACRISGDVLEIGVYRGGTAMLLRQALEHESATGSKTLRLFDTFTGMPETDAARDLHHAGDFSETSLEAVRARVGTMLYVRRTARGG